VGVWIGVAVMVVGSLVLVEVGRRASAGTLPRNHVVGLRLRSTMRDDEAWRLAHLAGGPALVRTGVLCAVSSLAAALVGRVAGEKPADAVLLVVCGVMLVGVAVAAWLGTTAIREP
jgi:uncharacterized membrane protein